jgi:hypothetical protein
MLVCADATIVEIPNTLVRPIACVVALPSCYKQNGFNGFLYCFHGSSPSLPISALPPTELP